MKNIITHTNDEEDLKELIKVVKYLKGNLAVQKLDGFNHYDCVISKKKLSLDEIENILIDKYGEDEVDRKSIRHKIR